MERLTVTDAIDWLLNHRIGSNGRRYGRAGERSFGVDLALSPRSRDHAIASTLMVDAIGAAGAVLFYVHTYLERVAN